MEQIIWCDHNNVFFFKDHIYGDDNNSDGGVNDDGDYNVDVVDKVKPQRAPLSAGASASPPSVPGILSPTIDCACVGIMFTFFVRIFAFF